MKRIIVLSDTHGLLRSEMLVYLSHADVIIHGGDINTKAIVDKLREYAPLYTVRGNNDREWAEDLPHSLTFAIEGVRFFLIHNKKDIPPDLSDVDMVIYGHSHKICLRKPEWCTVAKSWQLWTKRSFVKGEFHHVKLPLESRLSFY